MIFIIEDIKTNFSDEFLKLSPFREIITTKTLFDILNTWFNKISLTDVNLCDFEYGELIFRHEIFITLNLQTLINLFEFGFKYKIKLFYYTIAYEIYKKHIQLEFYDNKFYIFDLNTLKYDKTFTYDHYEVSKELITHIINIMSDCDYVKLNDNIKQKIVRQKTFLYNYHPILFSNEVSKITMNYTSFKNGDDNYIKELIDNCLYYDDKAIIIIPEIKNFYLPTYYNSETFAEYFDNMLYFKPLDKSVEIIYDNYSLMLNDNVETFYDTLFKNASIIKNNTLIKFYDGTNSIDKPNIYKIKIPKYITKIEDKAFDGCDNLTSIL